MVPACLEPETLACTRPVSRPSAANSRWQNARAGRLERTRTRRIALHGADVDAVLQVAQQPFVGVDDGDVVGLFAGQVVGATRIPTPGPADGYLW